MVIATFVSNSFHSFGLFHARITPAQIIRIKHTTRIMDIIILVMAHIIVGKTFVEFSVQIQFPIIGKSVFNFIPQHQLGHSCVSCCCCCSLQALIHASRISGLHSKFTHSSLQSAWTYEKANHINNTNNHLNAYDNILFFINFGIKK